MLRNTTNLITGGSKALLTLVLLIFIMTQAQTSFGQGQINTEMVKNKVHHDGFSFMNRTEFSFRNGNGNYINFYEDACLALHKEKNSYYLMGLYNFKEMDRAKDINKGYVHLRWTHDIGKYLSIETFGQKGFDQFISLRDRNIIGMNLRARLYNYQTSEDKYSCDRRLSVYGGFGFMFENENYNMDDGSVTRQNLARNNTYINVLWKINSYLNLSYANYYQAALNDLSNFRLLGNVDFEVKLMKNLSMTARYLYRFDNKPVAADLQFDQELIYGLKVDF